MNIITFEIKSALRSSIVWTLSMVGLFALMMLGVFPFYSGAKDQVVDILKNFPPQFSAFFGVNLEKIFSYGGFYNFAFMYISLVGAIMAASLSIGIFAREKRAKCQDFLLTKPLSRRRIFTEKFLACFFLLVAVNLVYLLCGILVYHGGNQHPYSLGTFIPAILGLFFTQLVFMAIGIALATLARKIRSVSGIATAIGFGAFILSAITNLVDDKNLAIFAPLKYFEPDQVFDSGCYPVKMICVAGVIIIACTGAAFVKFVRSDIHAV